MPPVPAPAPNQPARRWPWWKKTLTGLGIVLALTALFYRPIVFGIAKFAAHRLGPAQGLRIDFDLHGTIFTGLTIKDLRVSPTRPGAVQKCNVGLLEAHYSLPTLIRGGLSSDFIRSVTLHDVDAIIDPSKSPPAPPKKKEPFQLPPLPLPQRLSLRNVNFQLIAASKEIARAQGDAAATSSAVPAPAAPAVAGATSAVVSGGLLISKLNLDLDPDRPGEFAAAELRIPGGPDLRGVAARTSYKNRDLRITGLDLAPEIRLSLLEFDASGLPQERLKIALVGDVFGGQLNVGVQLRGIGKPPETKVALDLTGLSLGSVHDFLKLPAPLDGRVETAAVQFTGFADSPRTWVGAIDGKVSGFVAGEARVDRIDWRVRIRDGRAELEQAEAVQGANLVRLTATTELPAKMAELAQSSARGTLTIAAPDFGKLPVKLTTEVAGAFQAGGDFTLAGGKFSTHLKGRVRGLAIPAQQMAVSSLDFAIELAKTLPPEAAAAPGAPPPPPQPFFAGLQSRVAATVSELHYAQYRVDGLKLTVRTDQAAVKLEEFSLERGDNRLGVEGTYELPADVANWQTKPLAVRLKLAAPTVSQFSADQNMAPLHGKLAADADVALTGGVYAGRVNLSANGLEAKGARVDSADVRVVIENNRATFQSGEIRLDPRNTISLEGAAELQAPYEFKGGLNVALTDLAAFAPALAANGVNEKIGGALSIVAHGSGTNAAYEASLAITARDLQAAGAKIQSVDVVAVAKDQQAVIEKGEVRIDPKSALTFGGKAGLSAPYPYEGNVDLDLPDLGAFNSILAANGVNQPLAGSVKLTGQAAGRRPTQPGAGDQQLAGNVQLTALNLQAAGARVERIDGQIAVDKNLAVIKTLQIRYDAKNTIDLTGQAGLAEPFDYQANLNVNLSDLKSFEPILRASAARAPAAQQAAAIGEGSQKPKAVNAPVAKGRGARAAASKAPPAPAVPPEPRLAGTVTGQWQASGNRSKDPAVATSHGAARLALRRVEFNAIGPVEADLAGDYSPGVINVPTLSAATNGLGFGATLGLKDNLLRVDRITLRQGEADLLNGYLQLPLDLKKLSAPEGPVPDVDGIDVNIASKAIDLQTLLGALDKSRPAPAAGTAQLSVLAHGQLSKILAEIKLQARKVHLPQQPALAPADADLNLALRDDRLNLDLSVRQPQFQTLSVRGNIPLGLQTLLAARSIDPKSPVSLTVQLPRSDLGFIAKVSPAVRFIQGNIGADVKVGGTIEHPTFSGAASLNIPAARMQNISVPSVRDFQANLAFTEKALRLERFSGEIGGGKLNIGGGVEFANLKAPTLNLAITANNVLATRDDNLTARVNANLKISGPLAAATVAGSVGLTKSRYLKDINIIPIGLPGKPPPSTPAPAESQPSLSITSAPLKDWTFNLAIKTDDPFLVRGNLANGQALVDLRLRGTGLKPLLDGNVQVQNLVATLPFSRLTIDNGNVSFTPDQPLNPVIDLTGTSTIRTYLVSVYITGRARDPKIVFSSEPPLAQEQIVSLLATGSTTDELTGNSEALAGKATLLVVQDLYRRTFKKKKTSRTEEPKETLADKVDLDLGSTDPKTGKQEVSARFKVSDQVSFIGELGIEGDIQGRLRYLVRFR